MRPSQNIALSWQSHAEVGRISALTFYAADTDEERACHACCPIPRSRACAIGIGELKNRARVPNVDGRLFILHWACI